MPELITPGQELNQDEKGYTPDSIALDLLDELKERIEPLEDFRAYLENAPLGNAGDVGEHQQFPGIMELREMSKNNYAKLIVSATTDRLGILGFRTGTATSRRPRHSSATTWELVPQRPCRWRAGTAPLTCTLTRSRSGSASSRQPTVRSRETCPAKPRQPSCCSATDFLTET